MASLSLSGTKRPRDDGAAAAAAAADSTVQLQQLQPPPRSSFLLHSMESYHKKRTNDSIHSTIDICPVMQVFMDRSHPYFQRLRKLKQLGVTESVYMNATHTRKEHSLGVAHLAERLARRLATRQPQLRITEKDILCVKLAGLLHDMGHGPFSHVYDGPFLSAMREECKQRVERKAAAAASAAASSSSSSSSSAAVEDDPYDDVPPVPEDWTHEDASLDMIDAILRSNGLEVENDPLHLDEPLRQIGDGVDAQRFGISSAGDFGSYPCWTEGGESTIGFSDDCNGKPYPKERLLTSRDIVFIKECINGGPLHKGTEYVGRPEREKEFLYDIVSNRHSGLDVDKIDYFARDQRQCHKGSGEIELLFIEDAFVAWGECSDRTKCFQCKDCDPENSGLRRILARGHDSGGGEMISGKEGMHLMICYPDKMTKVALEFFKTRFRLHSEIYTHKTGKGVEFLLCDILKFADPYIRLRASEKYPKGLPISRAMLDPIAYSHLNDTIIDTIATNPDPRLQISKDLIDRYERREFYKYVCCVEISNDVGHKTRALWKKSKDDIRRELCDMKACHGGGESDEKIYLSSNDIIVEKREIHHGRKESNPVDMMRFLPKSQLSRLSKNAHDLPDAVKQSEGSYRSLIPRCFVERTIRIYSRSLDKKVIRFIGHLFEQWVELTAEGHDAPQSVFHIGEQDDDEDMGAGDDGGDYLAVANISQDDRTPPRRSVVNRNKPEVSIETNQPAEEKSPVPAPRGPTSLFRDDADKSGK